MKKIIIAIVCVCLPFFGMSQSVLDKFEDSDRIGSVTINKGMLDIVASMMEDDNDEDSKEFVEIAKGINNIKIFISEDAGASADMAATLKQYVKSSKLEELMKVKDGDTNLRFYIKNGKNEDRVEELLMFVTGIDDKKHGSNHHNFETVLLTMTGDIDLTKVGSLTRKMKLHKGLEKLDKE
ncbi:DUF4252 domain-containing protein [Flagellimonas hymeniacidonis]|uniref:DUF4252 domain-containing protein n=1 Tax=Flagellimonas hymeniacidonis TaxID=2603628 RepID=A0A5C8V207_9FLAO|nr:DUF4252 domain-containing protein [Flagellimonas hymeniacidonis]TXN35381.1 DUF4252 domain-containing protein [Flagellimonas hymeniacidonis]